MKSWFYTCLAGMVLSMSSALLADVTPMDGNMYCTYAHPSSNRVFKGALLITDSGDVSLGLDYCARWARENGEDESLCKLLGCTHQ